MRTAYCIEYILVDCTAVTCKLSKALALGGGAPSGDFAGVVFDRTSVSEDCFGLERGPFAALD